MNAPKSLAASILLVASATMAHDVTVDATCTPQVTRLEARLVEKAAEGPAALRNFIFIRRGIYALDMRETADRVRDIEAARAACMITASASQILDASAKVARN
jgi:hypothetical protein